MAFKKGYIPWNVGKKIPELVGNTFGKTNKGKVRTIAMKEKYSLSKMGDKNPMKRSEVKEKNRIAHLGKKCSPETRLKMSNSHPKGEKSPYWVKDRSQIKSNKDRHWGSSEYTQWRKEVFERDGYKCKIGNEKCESFVQAHHILSWRDYPELRYQLNNGITLCHAHHPKKRAKEKRLASRFQELVSVSK